MEVEITEVGKERQGQIEVEREVKIVRDKCVCVREGGNTNTDRS